MTTRRYIVSYTSTELERQRQAVRHRQVTWAYSARDALFQVREPVMLRERLQRKSLGKRFGQRGEWFNDFRVEPFPHRSPAHGMDCACPLEQPGEAKPGTIIQDLDTGVERYRINDSGHASWQCAVHGMNGRWEST